MRPWRSVWLWGRWVSAIKNREEQEKVCLLGFFVFVSQKKFIGLWVCWRLVCFLGLWV